MAGEIGRLSVMNYDDMRIVQEISSPTDRRRRTKMETGGGVVEARRRPFGGVPAIGNAQNFIFEAKMMQDPVHFSK